MIKYDLNEFLHLVNHIVLPYKLPNESSDGSIETHFLKLASNIVNDFTKSKLSFDSNFSCLTRLFERWLILQGNSIEIDSAKLRKELSSLTPNESLAIYIHNQNVCLLITMYENEAIMSYFQTSLDNKQVMSNNTIDIKASLPLDSIHIDCLDVLKSEQFSNLVSDLTSKTILETLPTSKKAGSDPKEIRDISRTDLISNWLFSILISNEPPKNEDNFPKRINKKFRDHINFVENIPFRRSGMWMSIKATLEIQLCNLYSKNNEGLICYKIIMILILEHLCSEFLLQFSNLDDLRLEMIKKLARKIYKLSKLTKIPNDILTKCNDTITRVRNLIEDNHKRLLNSYDLNIDLDYGKISFKDTIHLEFEQLKNKLDELKYLNQFPDNKKSLITIERNTNDCKFPNINTLDSSNDTISIALYDIENWVLNNTLTNEYFNQIAELYFKYIFKASTYYKHDQIGYSRMVLVLLKIVCFLDEIVCQMYPLLKQHHMGINFNIIEYLLVAKFEDLVIVYNQLIEYIFNRNSNANYQSLIDSNIDQNAFSVRYFFKNSNMQMKKDSIINYAENQKKLKLNEYDAIKKEYNNSYNEFYSLKCKCHSNYYGYKCQKCCLKNKIDNMTLQVYEWPLPSNETQANAIVFELNIPLEIAQLRDALYLFKLLIISNVKYSDNERCYELWINYFQLTQYSLDKQKYFTLGSPIKSYLQSHYSSPHISCPSDEFLVNNGLSVAMASLKEEKLITIDENFFTHLQEKTTFKAAKPYCYLQYAINSTIHSENQILADLNNLPSNLSVKEHVKFGFMRSGHRLQMRNLFDCLETRILSLNDVSVTALISQLLWQMGPIDYNYEKTFKTPSSHLDLLNNEFIDILKEVIETYLDQIYNKWNEYLVLYNLINITLRCFSLNKSDDLILLLIKCRQVASKWITDLNNLIKTQPDDTIKSKYFKQTVFISCFLILTYDVDKNKIEKILFESTHIETWLEAMKIINTFKSSNDCVSDTFLNNLLRRVEICCLNVTQQYIKLINESSECLTNFSKSNMSIEINSKWEPNDVNFSFPIWYSNKSNNETISISITGEILRNHFPMCLLPRSITNDMIYKSFFQSGNFECSFNAKEANFSSQIQFKTNQIVVFEFGYDMRQKLIIKEYFNNFKSIFIESTQLEAYFPQLLIENYSHWYNMSLNRLEFRPKYYSDDYLNSKIVKSTYDYVLNLNSFILSDKLDREMINFQSQTFNLIADKFSNRLDIPKYVHIFKSDSNALIVNFPRLDLNFKLDMKNKCLWSIEFSNYKVSNSQQIDTLIGLENYVLLIENEEYPIQKIVIPHGKIITRNDSNKRIIHITNDSNLKEEVYFVYQIDTDLKRLKADDSNTAWLYLALLHAVTSTLLEDKLLNMTGTEMALYLLQSAICWSIKPLSNESFKILEHLKNLSPKREYYPSHLTVMEKVSWPTDVPSYCAHEGFQFISEKLLNDSLVYKVAFQNSCSISNDENNNFKTSNLELAQKSYFRAAKLYRPSQFVTLLDWKLDQSRDFIEFKTEFKNEICNNIRLIQSQANTPHSKDFDFILKFEDLYWSKASELNRINKNVSCWFEPTCFSYSKNFEKYFVDHWAELYKLAQRANKSKEDEIKLKFILSYFAFKEIKLESLMMFKRLPKYSNLISYENNYNLSDGYDFSLNDIKSILDSNYMSLRKYNDKSHYNNMLTYYEYETKKSKSIDRISERLESFSKNLIYIEEPFNDSMIDNYAHEKFKDLFQSWKQNKALKLFFSQLKSYANESTDISIELNNLIKQPIILSKKSIDLVFELKPNKNDDDFYTRSKLIFETGQLEHSLKLDIQSTQIEKVHFPLKLHESEINNLSQEYYNNLTESWNSFYDKNQKKISIKSELENELKNSIDFYSSELSTHENRLKKFFMGDSSCQVTQCLIISGLWPCFTPNFFLRNLLSCSTNLETETIFNNIIGAFAVLMNLQKRMIRCIKYYFKKETHCHLLERELLNEPFLNWSPAKKPEWLILQLELDIMIRDIQVTVANKMLNSDTNTVIQLNMGEGKTAVIVPLLIASLTKQDYLVRLIVLKSLIDINYTALVFKIGLILNKKVYLLPFSRETNNETIKLYDKLLKECYTNKHVLLTLPEYCLSFKLKAEEKSNNEIKQLQNWIETKSKDILDESDEILTTKYQLVYSVGNQSTLDGEKLRWIVSRDVLKLARKHLEVLKEDYNNQFEYQIDASKPHKFPTIRLYNSNPFEKLRNSICDDFLNRNNIETSFHELNSNDKKFLKTFVLDKIINKEQIEMLKVYKNMQNIILILRGLLTYDILLHVLQKRWKVEYGVNIKTDRLLQAVPFRAKDVPAERAQYGHPEIFILLTYLSYYYSGLENSHLDTLFSMLENSPYGSSIYTKWIETLPSNLNIDSSIKDFESINLIDSNQKDQLIYPVLRWHTTVIDFWLDNVLFPKEAKEFDQKLSASAWDLASANTNLTTGFSGTNDSRFLLPLSIQFKHIPELIGTTGSVLSSIVNLDPDCYLELEMNSTEFYLLQLLKSNDIKVLIDVGALMIKYTNEQVINEWLQIDNDSEAAVFFNENKLMVKIKTSNKIQPFETSSYKQDLTKCLIYLDEFHTRGTDLKIPRKHLAGVTLSKGITKDRLFQACMRMRLLGNGHSCKFIASFEVSKLIKMNNYSKPQLNVLKWCIQNSINQISNEMIYWANQGISYYKKRASKNFIEECMNKLNYLYSNNRVEMFLHEIIKQKTKHLNLDFKPIIEKLETLGAHLKKYDQTLEEEMEKEIEIECEVEVETEKPKANGYKNKLSSDVVKFIKNGIFNKDSYSFMNLMATLNKSSVQFLAEQDAWSENIWASRDYADTVETSLFDDCFLRPPRWIALNKSEKIFLILSAYETNELFRYFNDKTILLMIMPRNRKYQLRILSFPQVFKLDEFKRQLEQIFIYSGSLYFNKLEEQEIFLQFVSYCLKRSELELKYIDDGLINTNSYVEKHNRSIVFNSSTQLSQFKKDPNEFIIKLIDLRNYSSVPELAHHLEIFLKGKFPLNN